MCVYQLHALLSLPTCAVVASLDSEMPHLSAQVAEAEVAETVFRNSEGETLVNVSNQLTYNFSKVSSSPVL